MSAWTRVAPGVTVFCGGCGEAIAPEAPVYHVTIAGVARPLARCATCAGPAPPDLPARPVLAPPPPVFVRIGQIRAPLGLDWRARAAGRDPGEDDA